MQQLEKEYHLQSWVKDLNYELWKLQKQEYKNLNQNKEEQEEKIGLGGNLDWIICGLILISPEEFNIISPPPGEVLDVAMNIPAPEEVILTSSAASRFISSVVDVRYISPDVSISTSVPRPIASLPIFIVS